MKRTVQIELAAIVAVVLALVGISRVRINSGAPALEVLNEAATGVDMVEPGEAFGPQPAEGNPVPGASPNSRNSTRTEGSSKAGTSPVRGGARSEEENPPAGTSSRYSETAGPPVFYTDQANDAYGPDSPPNAALSQSAFDILRVDWGPVAYVDEQNPGGYSTSITIAGAAREDVWYVSFGSRPGCTLYHALAPGTTAFATSICYPGGRVPGSRVSSTPTPDGGTLLSATFDNRAMPPPWRADRTLRDLSAMTCMYRTEAYDCSPYDVLDRANSTLTYRV